MLADISVSQQLVALLVPVIIGFGKIASDYVASKFGPSSLGIVHQFASVAVQGAEQALDGNDEKLVHAMAAVKAAAKRVGITLSDEMARSLVESAVVDLKRTMPPKV